MKSIPDMRSHHKAQVSHRSKLLSSFYYDFDLYEASPKLYVFEDADQCVNQFPKTTNAFVEKCIMNGS